MGKKQAEARCEGAWMAAPSSTRRTAWAAFDSHRGFYGDRIELGGGVGMGLRR